MFERLRLYLRGMSWPIIVAMLALMTISVLSVRAAEQAGSTPPGFTLRQAIYVVVALVGFLVAVVIPYPRIGRGAYVWFGLTLALLVVVLFLPANKGSRRWIDLKFFNIQPSELAKLTYIIALAWYLRYRDNYRRVAGLIPPFVLTLAPAGLILIEPDLGTTLLWMPTLGFMLFMAGAKIRHLLAVVAVAALVVFLPVPTCLDGVDTDTAAARKDLAYWHGTIGDKEYVVAAAPVTVMRYHQLTRIYGWLKQADDDPKIARRVAKTSGFQLRQSMIILGSGGVRGQRVLEQKHLYFRMLPDDHTDFIYAVIGGQWGLVGCAGVIVIYVGIFICAAEIAAMTDDPFGRLLVVGVLALLLTQIFINVGMTMGLMPITGMTLPLVSYGGSSMLINAMSLGLVVNVGIRRPILLGRKPFEYGPKPDRAGQYDSLRGGNGKSR